MSMKRRQRTYAIGLVVLVVIAAGSLYYKNAHLSGAQKNGSITITVPERGSGVFLDNKHKTVTTKADQEVTFKKLDDKVHSILVDTPGAYPWYKAFDLSKDKSPALTSYAVATTLSKIEILTSDPKYQSVKTVVEKAALPSITSKKRSANGNVDLWVDAATNSIHAEWIGDPGTLPRFFCPLGTCSPHLVILNGKTPIRSVDFFKNREDVIIVAIDNSISALELDISPPQNFQPIFLGTAPRFDQPENGILFIESGATLSVVRY